MSWLNNLTQSNGMPHLQAKRKSDVAYLHTSLKLHQSQRFPGLGQVAMKELSIQLKDPTNPFLTALICDKWSSICIK